MAIFSRHASSNIVIAQFTMNVCLRCGLALVLVTVAAASGLNFRLYGVNYSPRQGADWDPNRCKTQHQVQEDMLAIATFADRVRIYSLADCGQGAMVLHEAKAAGLKVWLGMWVTASNTSIANELTALQSLVASGLVDKSVVVGLHVGSENLYRKDITPDQAIAYLNQVKTYLASVHLTFFPVTITDVLDTLLQYPQVVAAVDVVMANEFPFWEAVDISGAIDRFKTKLAALKSLAGTKPIEIGETGWASAGQNANASVASRVNQATYLASFATYATSTNLPYYWFAAIDEAWKGVQEADDTTVEAHFGLLDSSNALKAELVGLSLSGPPTPSPNNNPTTATPTPQSASGAAALKPTFVVAVGSIAVAMMSFV
ncbi:Aste57867_19130 [Aphanomyces stellatus]|uniref:glucan endo-1,3-beta-D-glucosidase n=1 Tax=Aphanomyces stellatus TaxID=120398 RepID=A0A485LC17_9STRA|nr:hypothetical protein As57867_019066 [Aphanomyces stellatus]VFT95853.1 Aste57867_19130 [Aphanomyces stellatus]